MAQRHAYRIVIVNSLLDNVHGFIGLTDVENAIERLPIFKRLKDISQLGLTSRIFPCALHNRYIHSLGVMYIADQMAIRLNFDDDERQLVRLAAMLHDIGHYPFSHDVESAYIAANKAIEISPEDELKSFAKSTVDSTVKLASSGRSLEYFMNGRSDKHHHESVGSLVIQSSTKIKGLIISKYIHENSRYAQKDDNQVLESLIADICAIIVGDAQHISEYFGEKFTAMVQMMHSELDADRIDYLLRDATFSGASYGSFDVGMLIQNLAMAKDPQSNTYVIGVNQKGICCAEQLLISRYFAYSQVIFHKYTSVLGCTLQSVVRWLIQDRSSGFQYGDILDMARCHEKDSRFLSYTDGCLMGKINEIDPSKMPCPEIIYKLTGFLQDYQSLSMDKEVVCSGINIIQLHKEIIGNPLYSALDAEIKFPDSIDRIYQYWEMKLTNHVPEAVFREQLKVATANGSIEEDMADSYLLDRLQDGVAVIEEGKGPYLLIDSPRSMLHDVYNLRYCILRSYLLD